MVKIPPEDEIEPKQPVKIASTLLRQAVILNKMNLRRFSPLLLLAVLTTVQASDTRISDVIYQKRGGFALTMDVFKPEKPNGAALIWVVSAGWNSHHQDINPQRASVFTARGLTVFEVVHGSQPRFKVAEIALDIQRAVRFIRFNSARFGIDPMRIGISGASAGGHLSLMTAAYGAQGPSDSVDPVDRESAAVEAVGVFFPPTDMLNWGKDGVAAFTLPMLKIFWPAAGITEKTSPADLTTLSHELSPIYGVTDKFPPTLLVHGDKDPLVPLQQSQLLNAKLAQLGVVHKLIVVPGGQHGWKDMAPQMLQVAEWIDEKLRK